MTIDNKTTSTMNVWLLWTLYFAMLNYVIDGQPTLNNDQPSNKVQHSAGLLNNVMHLLYQQQQQTRQLVRETFDRQNDVIIHINQTLSQQQRGLTNLNQTVGLLHEKLDQQSQHFNQTLGQQQGDLTKLNQTLGQLNGYIYQQSQLVAGSVLQQLELGLLCSSIPWPTVENAKQSIKRTSNETIITYTCHVGYEFKRGVTTRSTTCNGFSWTPIDSNCIKQQLGRPVLTNIIRGDRHVHDLTSCNNQLFVTRNPSNSQIEVYDTTTFEWIRNITVSVGSFLGGLAPCPTGDCLYLSDNSYYKVHKLNLSQTPRSNTAVTTTSWPLGGGPLGLSVNRLRNVLVAFGGSKKIAEYTPSGSLVREMSDGNNMFQAVEHVVNGTFVVSRYGPVHGVGLMSFDGRVIHSYGSTTRGSGPGQMNEPRSLAVDRDGFVLVADSLNNRILVLNPTLSDVRPLLLPTNDIGQPLNGPVGLWLDESRGRLYVGEWNSPYRVLVYDGVFNIGTIFTP